MSAACKVALGYFFSHDGNHVERHAITANAIFPIRDDVDHPVLFVEPGPAVSLDSEMDHERKRKPAWPNSETRQRWLTECRLRLGEIWRDPVAGHVVGCGDATDRRFVAEMCGDSKASLAVHDPPYNLIMFEKRSVPEFIAWCRDWIANTEAVLTDDASLYVWLGADQKKHYEPLPQFAQMMSESAFASRSMITMRNQRGYGTQRNWMAVRQELLYYTIGRPEFDVQYTDIPKILRGYYKDVGGQRTENMERSRSDCIRPGNVWVDIQQVFYRMKENVAACPAQKPLKALERIIEASSRIGDTVVDLFAHSGTSLLAAELQGRRCVTCDIDPVFAEISIRRLERFRDSGQTGWQMSSPFEEVSEPDEVSTTGPHL
jgi:site-specific DNA-methyltransferase (adenine-specific)